MGVMSTSAKRTSPAINPRKKPPINILSNHSDHPKPQKKKRNSERDYSHTHPSGPQLGLGSQPFSKTSEVQQHVSGTPSPPPPHLAQRNEIPPPTSPHKFHKVAILDIVTEVAHVDPVFSLADLGKLDGLFVRRVHRAAEGASKGVRRRLAAFAAARLARRGARGPGPAGRVSVLGAGRRGPPAWRPRGPAATARTRLAALRGRDYISPP